MNGYAVQDAWVKYAQEQRDKEARKGQVDWDNRWHAAAAWCQQHLPDVLDNRGITCGFAVGSALALKSKLGRTPTPGEVRAHRAGWMRRLDVADAINCGAARTRTGREREENPT